MKCIKNVETGVIERVRDQEAESRTKNGKWVYQPKSSWKQHKKALVPVSVEPETKAQTSES